MRAQSDTCVCVCVCFSSRYNVCLHAADNSLTGRRGGCEKCIVTLCCEYLYICAGGS